MVEGGVHVCLAVRAWHHLRCPPPHLHGLLSSPPGRLATLGRRLPPLETATELEPATSQQPGALEVERRPHAEAEPQGRTRWCCACAAKWTNEGASDGVAFVPKRPMRAHQIVLHAVRQTHEGAAQCTVVPVREACQRTVNGGAGSPHSSIA